MRPEQLLHPQRPAAALLDAATLLLVRPGEAEDACPPDAVPPDAPWQVLMTRRRAQASFAPGAYVFPGGGLEAQDAQLADDAMQGNAADVLLHRADMQGAVLQAAIAAVRETFEEMGLLLAIRADGSALSQTDVDALDRRAALLPQLRAHGLKLDLRGVWPLAHWTAATFVPKRFDVPFFIATAPTLQSPVADESEQFEPVWVQPAQAVRAHRAGQMPMIFPTLRTLEKLAAYPDTAAIFEAVHDGLLWRSTPRGGRLKGELHVCTQDDPGYGELGLVCPDGQPRHALDWQSDTPVPLRRNLLRLTAPNASTMTGPGTNSYLVGDASSGYIVIDPGPADTAHVQRLFDAAGGDIRHIVCTHSHPDHSPGATLLQALCVDRGYARPAIYGMPSGAHARADSRFAPDVVLADGDTLRVSAAPGTAPTTALTYSGHTQDDIDAAIASGSIAADRVPAAVAVAAAPAATTALPATAPQPTTSTHTVHHTLRAIHTPGHTANHLCLLLEEDGLLFTGDHILGGSTTVIIPPDGDMTAFLDSLQRLAAECLHHNVTHLLPAHGYALEDPQAVIGRLRAHRLAREARVLHAMHLHPEGDEHAWLAIAYADTPVHLHPIALHSLRAHVQRIRELGLRSPDMAGYA